MSSTAALPERLPSPPAAASNTRRLAAYVHADIAGYSRLVGLDDTGTSARLADIRLTLIDPALSRFGGRVVNTAGDSLLMEFGSVLSAVRCAVELQGVMPDFDEARPPEQRIRFRMGVHIGDAIAEGGNLHGDGVNIAARLQAVCPPGELCVSRAVRDEVRGRLGVEFEPLGPLELKNIARPIEAFRLRIGHDGAKVTRPGRMRWPQAGRRAAFAGLAGLILFAAAGAVIAIGEGWLPRWWAPSNRTTARPAADSFQDRRLSIIVLPFENSGGDPAQDGVAARIARDVTDRLAESNDVPLVAAATETAYRGKALDLRAIGRDRDVHFALNGNARLQDGHLIVTATLRQTEDERPVWSRRFDLPDQPDSWTSIAYAIEINTWQAAIDAEAGRARREHPDSLDKRDLLIASLASSLAAATKEAGLARIALVERALALDPDYVPALRFDGQWHAQHVLFGFSSDPAADLAKATKAFDRAIVLAQNDLGVLKSKVSLLRAQRDFDGAAGLLHQILERVPLWGWPRRDLGLIQLIQGQYREALENFMIARRLVPSTDAVKFIDSCVALGLLANDRFPEAIERARVAIPQMTPDDGAGGETPWLVLIAAESLNGHDVEAHADLQKFLATPRIRRTLKVVRNEPSLAGVPKLLDGLRRAGMAEDQAE